MMRIVITLAALGLLVAFSAPPARELHPDDFRPVVLRPGFARTVARPFLPMVVDMMWLRALNAIGLKDSLAKNRALYEYGVAITDLDPRFKQVYEFIGLNIPYAMKRDTFVGGELACDLFRRGLKAYPNDLKLHMYLGFSLFHHERKFNEASEVFAAASLLPGALPYMAPLATRLKAHSGRAEDALQLTLDLLNQELEEPVRAELEARAADLQVEIVLQQIDRAAKDFTERTGQPPASYPELQRFYPELPSTDPLGGFITLEEDGTANSTSLERRVEIYE